MPNAGCEEKLISMVQIPDFLIVGGGIFGLSTAIALRKRKHRVQLINPDSIPHPLAASTDISKVVRMEYGSDTTYMHMADRAIEGWHAWNEQFGEVLYHETGFILAAGAGLDSGLQPFEEACYHNLLNQGFHPERLQPDVSERFPAFAHGVYPDGFFHPRAGFAKASRTLESLLTYAISLGVDVREGQTATEIVTRGNRAWGVSTAEGEAFRAGQIVIAAGNSTPYLVPELLPYFRVTGHPVFHIMPATPEKYTVPHFAVFSADIANTGWYGFPLHPDEGVVKVGHHGPGIPIHPQKDERVVPQSHFDALATFLNSALPDLAGDPVVYSRLCCYTDTLDGHFWIDNHPEIKGLLVASGGSGHGFKMGPIIGDYIAGVAEGRPGVYQDRFGWRHLEANVTGKEEARAAK